MEKYSYLCNVFFIVLDLRLTRLDYGGSPFFYVLKLTLLGFKPMVKLPSQYKSIHQFPSVGEYADYPF